MSQKANDIQYLASQYLNDEVATEDEALQGAREIIAEWINENDYVRKNLRWLFQRKALMSSKVVKTKKENIMFSFFAVIKPVLKVLVHPAIIELHEGSAYLHK